MLGTNALELTLGVKILHLYQIIRTLPKSQCESCAARFECDCGSQTKPLEADGCCSKGTLRCKGQTIGVGGKAHLTTVPVSVVQSDTTRAVHHTMPLTFLAEFSDWAHTTCPLPSFAPHEKRTTCFLFILV